MTTDTRSIRDRLPMRRGTQPPGRGFLAVLGAIGIGFALLMVWIGFRAPDSIPGRSYYNLDAAFRNADNIAKHSQVRVGGRIVGQVLDPRVEHGRAVIRLQMEPSVGPLLSDTRAIVRPRSAVGVRYVEVVPGEHGRPLHDGALIPASQTGATRQLDEALSTFDAPTRLRTQRLLRALGTGLAGRGEDLNEGIGALPRFLRGTREVAAAIAARPGAIRSFIRGTAGAAGAAQPVREAIATGFAPEAAALRPFTDHAVQQSLDAAPPALAAVRAGLARTTPLVVALGRLAARVRPGLAVAPAAFRETDAMLRGAEPGLEAAPSTLRTTAKAVDPTVALLDRIEPMLPNLRAALTDGLPIVDELGRHGCDIKLFGDNWGSMMAFGNSGGGFLRFNLTGGDAQTVYGLGSAAKNDVALYQNPYPKPCTAGSEPLTKGR